MPPHTPNRKYKLRLVDNPMTELWAYFALNQRPRIAYDYCVVYCLVLITSQHKTMEAAQKQASREMKSRRKKYRHYGDQWDACFFVD